MWQRCTDSCHWPGNEYVSSGEMSLGKVCLDWLVRSGERAKVSYSCGKFLNQNHLECEVSIQLQISE